MADPIKPKIDPDNPLPDLNKVLRPNLRAADITEAAKGWKRDHQGHEFLNILDADETTDQELAEED